MILEDQIHELARAARNVSRKAYCPYSRFPVGAALLTCDGHVFLGCNVENASYGLTICAERNAIFQAVAAGERRVRAMVIYTPTETPSAPCGACRQVICEFGQDALVVALSDGPGILQLRASELLPAAFGPNDLNQESIR